MRGVSPGNTGSMRFGRILFAVATVCCAVTMLSGCHSGILVGVPCAPHDQLDAHGIALENIQHLVRGDRTNTVMQILGQPADRQPSCVPNEIV